MGQFKAGQFKACGSDASTKYTIDPEIVFFLIDLDANWELFDRLVEDHPAIAFTLAISSIALSRWTEDGALTNARDQRHHNGHLLSIPSPEYVRRFVSGEKLDLADAEQLNSPLPDGATSVYMESFFSHVPGGQGEIIARASIIRQSETDGENYEVIAILSQVRFRLALLEKDVFEVQHRSSAVTPRGQGSIYKLADMVDMTPTRRGFSGIEEEVEAC